MKTTRNLILNAILIFFGAGAAANSSSYEIQYEFVDAVVVRRIIVGLPQYDRPEILGTGTLYVNGTSNLVLGQYDLTVKLDDNQTRSAFKVCLNYARVAIQQGEKLTIKGTSSHMPSGGYKNLIFLDSLIECRL
ncbi:MAG: hypothetical protein H0U60_15135 [Blastocatellia bacterium]|nr:hypothetical protein [Blastocatellia bacterium]